MGERSPQHAIDGILLRQSIMSTMAVVKSYRDRQIECKF